MCSDDRAEYSSHICNTNACSNDGNTDVLAHIVNTDARAHDGSSEVRTHHAPAVLRSSLQGAHRSASGLTNLPAHCRAYSHADGDAHHETPYHQPALIRAFAHSNGGALGPAHGDTDE